MDTHDEPTPSVEGEPAALNANEERMEVSAREQETGAVCVRTITHYESREVPVLLRSSAVRIERGLQSPSSWTRSSSRVARAPL